MPLHSSHQPPLTPHQSPRSVRVLQLSTVHPWDDNRICRKICVSLVEDGYDVVLMARDANSEASIPPEGVELHILPNPKNRIRRGLISLGIWRSARKLRPDIVHFHDPELIPAGLFLRMLGYKVIYDVHEDYPEKMRTKRWIPAPIRRIMGFSMWLLEKLGSRFFSSNLFVTQHIGQRFPRRNSELLRNYPRLTEVVPATSRPAAGDNLIYVGGLDVDRGTLEMIAGLEAATTPARRLELHGTTDDAVVNARLDAASSSGLLLCCGWSSRTVVKERLAQAVAGLVLLRPTTAYLESLPTKLFEYMGAGLPVIASDFPVWRKIIETHECGVLVDPSDATAIAAAIDWMYQHPEQARAMGENGRHAIRSELNWESEAKVLRNTYGALA